MNVNVVLLEELPSTRATRSAIAVVVPIDFAWHGILHPSSQFPGFLRSGRDYQNSGFERFVQGVVSPDFA